MSDILSKITKYKLAEIAEAKHARPQAAIEEAARRAPPVRSFAGALERRTREGQFALIAEVKARHRPGKDSLGAGTILGTPTPLT